MTRPPAGVSFAQFFPNAPRVRAEAQAQAQAGPKRAAAAAASVGEPAASSLPPPPPPRPPAAATLHADVNPRPSSDAPRSHVDDNDSPLREIPSTDGSASSASSILSKSMRTSATAPPSQLSTITLPFAARDSLSRSPALPAKQGMPVSRPADQLQSAASPNVQPADNGTSSTTCALPRAERVPARDSRPSVKGLKCTYDPILERARKKGVSKNAKPVFKEFGLVRTTIPCPG